MCVYGVWCAMYVVCVVSGACGVCGVGHMVCDVGLWCVYGV